MKLKDAQRAKLRASEVLEGTYKEQYAQLGDYCEELYKTNPGSTAVLLVNRPHPELQPYFERFYVCLDACKRGFLSACRPFIGVDGCHLKGEFTGQLLTAVGKDGNYGIYPIAFAVVEAETKESWTWFLSRLLEDIGGVNERRWTFMSDQQKGLVPTFDELMPGVDHRFCVRHLYNNFSKEHKGKLLKDRMWAAARATNMGDFRIEMENIKKINHEAWEWFVAKPPELWTRAAFKTFPRCDALTNNLCESFNALILEFRDKPIITMIEEIRCCLMDRYVKMKQLIARYKGPICPRIQHKLEIEKINSRLWVVVWCGDEKDVSGIPCVHSMAALGSKGEQVEDYVHQYYRTESLAAAWEPCVYPTSGSNLWPQSNRDPILPPPHRRQPGRPKKLRKRECDEPRNPYKMPRTNTHIRCSQCGVLGHNKRRCKDNEASNQQRKKPLRFIINDCN
nr:uncharacterized protein LOC111990411 [Quercus suber]